MAVVTSRFSSAAACRSTWYDSSSSSPAHPLSTNASFQAAFSASGTPELSPRAPNGATRWAQSPARSTRPTRIREATREWKR